MLALELFINNGQSIDPLVCIALINYKFETTHPLYDGNRRTGRIINILYLVICRLLDAQLQRWLIDE